MYALGVRFAYSILFLGFIVLYLYFRNLQLLWLCKFWMEHLYVQVGFLWQWPKLSLSRKVAALILVTILGCNWFHLGYGSLPPLALDLFYSLFFLVVYSKLYTIISTIEYDRRNTACQTILSTEKPQNVLKWLVLLCLWGPPKHWWVFITLIAGDTFVSKKVDNKKKKKLKKVEDKMLGWGRSSCCSLKCCIE